MRSAGFAYVYAVVRADETSILDERYPEDRFELLDRAQLDSPERMVEGRLYRLRGP